MKRVLVSSFLELATANKGIDINSAHDLLTANKYVVDLSIGPVRHSEPDVNPILKVPCFSELLPSFIFTSKNQDNLPL